MNFVAIDVETANADMASICQVGIAKYENGALTEEWKSYVNPEDEFDAVNIAIHGIDETLVKDAPTFPALFDAIRSFLGGAVVVCHTHFDRVAIHQSADRYNLTLPTSTWLDSAKVARRTWPQFAWKGYGLYDVSRFLGRTFKHHDALEDAKAAASIVLAARNVAGLDIEGWLKRVKQPIDNKAQFLSREGNPDGPLFGEVLVFTGALEIPRREAADLAAAIGCQVTSGVSKNTTLLVVGDQDLKKLAGNEKSSKHRKAEQLIAEGISIRILKESDFRKLAQISEELA